METGSLTATDKQDRKSFFSGNALPKYAFHKGQNAILSLVYHYGDWRHHKIWNSEFLRAHSWSICMAPHSSWHTHNFKSNNPIEIALNKCSNILNMCWQPWLAIPIIFHSRSPTCMSIAYLEIEIYWNDLISGRGDVGMCIVQNALVCKKQCKGNELQTNHIIHTDANTHTK